MGLLRRWQFMQPWKGTHFTWLEQTESGVPHPNLKSICSPWREVSSHGMSYQSEQLTKSCGSCLQEVKKLGKSFLMSSTQGQSCQALTDTSPELEFASKSLCPAMQLNQYKFNVTKIPLLCCILILTQIEDTWTPTWPFITKIHTKTPISNIGNK